MSDEATTPADASARSVWIKAGALVGVVAVALVVLGVVVGRRTPTLKPDALTREMAKQYGVELTPTDAACMIDAEYGNAVDLSALVCLRGEQRRYFADVLWRQLAPVPASQQAVECFTAWAMSDEAATKLASIGAAGQPVDVAQTDAVDYVRQSGVVPCASR